MSSGGIAIIGGGISGLTLAYELARRGHAGDVTLFEATSRLGGIVETVARDGFVIECGPDAWITEKPWARELAGDLGLEDDLLQSNDATRKTYILQQGRLQPMPDGMRLMVPTDLDAVCRSPLFSPAALASFQREMARSAELLATAPAHDESVASFVERHFGQEVLATVAAPLLSGIFGGDVRRLSARAVLPQLVILERRHGSLILGLQQRPNLHPESTGVPFGTALPGYGERRPTVGAPAIFTTLRGGLGDLVKALASQIPEVAVRRNTIVRSVWREHGRWILDLAANRNGDESVPSPSAAVLPTGEVFDTLVLATPLLATRALLERVDARAAALLPPHASSAVTIAFAWADPQLSLRDRRRTGQADFAPPPGFGLLVPPRLGVVGTFGPQILAATFADQKFAGRVPDGGRLLRVFYGGAAAERLWHLSDQRLSARALAELRHLLGPLPAAPPGIVLRRWRHSLPQYEVGHLERVAEIGERLRSLAGLHLLGNTLRSVGLPDLIRDARALAPVLRP